MIERHDVVLSQYTDEYLLDWRERGDGQRVYANWMLQAPAEYRQGVASRVHDLMSRTEYHDGGIMVILGGVGSGVAYAQALMELHAQGVALLPVPA